MTTTSGGRVRSLAGAASARVDVILVAVLGAVSVVPFGRLFVSYRFMWLVAGAALLALAVSFTVSPRRPLAVALTCGVAAFIAYLTIVVFHVVVPTPSALGDVWEGVTSSWARLLTASLPASDTPELLALPVLLGSAGSFAGIELANRRQSISLPVLPPLGALVIALAFTGKRPTGSLVLPVVVVALGLAVTLIRSNTIAAPGTPAGTGSGEASRK